MAVISLDFHPTGTVTELEYGSYQHGIPGKGCPEGQRLDLYTPHDEEGRPVLDRVHTAGHADDSPIFTGKYDPKCSCCWLGFGHTVKCHERKR